MSVPSFSASVVLFVSLLILGSSISAGQNSVQDSGGSSELGLVAKDPYGLTSSCFSNPLPARSWHAFVLVGTETFFASHITNLCMEVHKYQFIIKVSLPENYRSTLIEERKRHPADSFFVSNLFPDDSIGSRSDPMNLPDLAAGRRTSFVGNIWRGIPNKPAYNDWPWRGVQPILSNVPISIQRVVHFVPFSHSTDHPERLNYLLFGSGAEAHMVHLQTTHGSEPDYDHVVSLGEVPKWLPNDLLEAGAAVDLPDKPRFGNDKDRARGVRCAPPFQNETEINVRYRGEDPRSIKIGTNKFFCTRIANNPDPCQEVNEQACGSATPQDHLAP